ncbi:MAG: hypothetical protein IBJ10_11865, partial [Phycisphaerales bacterium]|nr:hypothetical protein [Phycisphaerales bacterium]
MTPAQGLMSPAKPHHDAHANPAGQRFDVAGRRCYLLGIGGCGMSALARMLRARGAIVSGSDAYASPVTEALALEGTGVDFNQATGELPDDAQMVIASAAIKPDNPQLAAAMNRGLPVLTYAEALGKCMLGRTGVALAGTHGKSTTTAMLGVALTAAGLDPTVIVGATCAQLSPDGHTPTGFRLGADAIPRGELKGRPGLLLAEACEFNRSFHNLHPTIGSISAVEADHLDIYGSLDAVVQSFRDFAALLPLESEGGRLIIAHEGAHRREVTAGVRCAVETIGFAPGADWHIDFNRDHRRVTLSRGRDPVPSWLLPLPGEHMAFHSALASAPAGPVRPHPARPPDGLRPFQGG